jgi:hypothetical protein
MLADAFLEGVKRHDAEYQRFNVAPSVLQEAGTAVSEKIRKSKDVFNRDFARFSQEAMASAVGKEGEDGDPEAIAELAAQWVKIYEDILAEAVEFCDRDAPPPVHLLYLVVALMNATPLREIREFAEQFDREVHDAAAELRAGREPKPIFARLTLTIDDEATKTFDSVVDWLTASMGRGK